MLLLLLSDSASNNDNNNDNDNDNNNNSNESLSSASNQIEPEALHNGNLQCTIIITRYTNSQDARDINVT